MITDEERRRLAAQPPPHITGPDQPLPRIGEPEPGPLVWLAGRDDEQIAAHKSAAASRRWREETARAHAAEDQDQDHEGHGH